MDAKEILIPKGKGYDPTLTQDSNQRLSGMRTHFCPWSCVYIHVAKYTIQILAILLPVKMNEIEGTRPNSCSEVFAR